MPCIQTSNRTLSAPVLSDIVYGFETLDTKELSSFDNPAWKYGGMIIIFQHFHFVKETALNFAFQDWIQILDIHC